MFASPLAAMDREEKACEEAFSPPLAKAVQRPKAAGPAASTAVLAAAEAVVLAETFSSLAVAVPEALALASAEASPVFRASETAAVAVGAGVAWPLAAASAPSLGAGAPKTSWAVCWAWVGRTPETAAAPVPPTARVPAARTPAATLLVASTVNTD